MKIDWKNNPIPVEKGLAHWLELMEKKLQGESVSINRELGTFYKELDYELTVGQISGLVHYPRGLFHYHVKKEYGIELSTRVKYWQEKGLEKFLEFKQNLEAKLKYIHMTTQQMTFLDAAYRVLKDSEAPLHYKNITQQALSKGYIETKGKTPEQTMTAMLNSEIQKKGAKSRFTKVKRAIYGLSEWGKEPIEPKPKELDHEELILHLMELGEINGYETIPEYSCDHFRLDVVWLSKFPTVPKYCFEIHLSGTPAKDIAALKHAYDKWNSEIFIISKSKDLKLCKDMIAGSFHEIETKIKILDAKKVLEYCIFKAKFKEINGLLG